MSSKLESIFQKINIPNNNKELFFLSLLIVFSVLVRVVPFGLVTIITLILATAAFATDFYIYTNKFAKDENKNVKTTEFSWGIVKEKKDMMDMVTLYKYLTQKDLSFYKNYLHLNKDKILIIFFVFGDLLVAFKNLDMQNAGIYIALSIFTKFVFLGFVIMYQTYKKILVEDKNTEENILDVFYSQFNSMVAVFIGLFILVFILSRYIIDIFFGVDYIGYHSSLPFVLLANMFLTASLCVYITAVKLDEKLTNKITKVVATILFTLFVFMTVNYIDTVTYFIVGSMSLLSIFLYNFIIKKPEYIKNTYNLTF